MADLAHASPDVDAPVTGASEARLLPMTTDHLEAAWALSQAEQWPHRREDWELGLEVGCGVVAVEGGRIVGTACVTPYGETATVNMIIVTPEMRGKGLGRRLVDAAMSLSDPQEWRLVATTDGLPLYRKLGFVEVGRIFQCQGEVRPAAVAADAATGWLAPGHVDAVLACDRRATGMDRSLLIRAIARDGRIAALREQGTVNAYAALRRFGFGEVIGPVIAPDIETAERLFAFVIGQGPGGFLRVDTPEETLVGWLEARGLRHVSSGTAMRKAGHEAGREASSVIGVYGLASQAFG